MARCILGVLFTHFLISTPFVDISFFCPGFYPCFFGLVFGGGKEPGIRRPYMGVFWGLLF